MRRKTVERTDARDRDCADGQKQCPPRLPGRKCSRRECFGRLCLSLALGLILQSVSLFAMAGSTSGAVAAASQSGTSAGGTDDAAAPNRSAGGGADILLPYERNAGEQVLDSAGMAGETILRGGTALPQSLPQESPVRDSSESESEEETASGGEQKLITDDGSGETASSEGIEFADLVNALNSGSEEKVRRLLDSYRRSHMAETESEGDGNGRGSEPGTEEISEISIETEPASESGGGSSGGNGGGLSPDHPASPGLDSGGASRDLGDGSSQGSAGHRDESEVTDGGELSMEDFTASTENESEPGDFKGGSYDGLTIDAPDSGNLERLLQALHLMPEDTTSGSSSNATDSAAAGVSDSTAGGTASSAAGPNGSAAAGAHVRPADDSDGAADQEGTAAFIARYMQDLGFLVDARETSAGTDSGAKETARQTADPDAAAPSAIVIAERAADCAPADQTDDVLLLTAPYNMTGAAALLETARLIRDIRTDTDLCFVFYKASTISDFASRLSKQVRERITGVIDVRQVGYLPAEEACDTDGSAATVSSLRPFYVLETRDGGSTDIGSELQLQGLVYEDFLTENGVPEKWAFIDDRAISANGPDGDAITVPAAPWDFIRQQTEATSAFDECGIPAVTLSEYFSPADTMSTASGSFPAAAETADTGSDTPVISIAALSQVTEVLSHTVGYLMSTETGSYLYE